MLRFGILTLRLEKSNMKTNLGFFAAISLFSLTAHAEVKCEAIKIEKPNLIERLVRVTVNGQAIEDLSFGNDLKARNEAGKACWEVLNASACSSTKPRVSDQYQNAGDPGFGPRLNVQKSTIAGILSLSQISKKTETLLPDHYFENHGRYFAFYEECDQERAKLAIAALRSAQETLSTEYNRSHLQGRHQNLNEVYDAFGIVRP
jgi:hypothetical protein